MEEGTTSLNMQLFDLSGKAITLDFKKQIGRYTTSTSELAKGVYFLRISSNKEQVVRKVIKQ